VPAPCQTPPESSLKDGRSSAATIPPPSPPRRRRARSLPVAGLVHPVGEHEALADDAAAAAHHFHHGVEPQTGVAARLRNLSTCASRPWQIRDTSLFESRRIIASSISRARAARHATGSRCDARAAAPVHARRGRHRRAPTHLRPPSTAGTPRPATRAESRAFALEQVRLLVSLPVSAIAVEPNWSVQTDATSGSHR
jgi:hypothetical protein